MAGDPILGEYITGCPILNFDLHPLVSSALVMGVGQLALIICVY